MPEQRGTVSDVPARRVDAPLTCRLRVKPAQVGQRPPPQGCGEVELENTSDKPIEITLQMSPLQYLNLVVKDSAGNVISEGHYGNCFSPLAEEYTFRLEPGQKYTHNVSLLGTVPEAKQLPGRYTVQAVYQASGLCAASAPLGIEISIATREAGHSFQRVEKPIDPDPGMKTLSTRSAETSAQVLRAWAELGRTVTAGPRLPGLSWKPAERMIRAAHGFFSVQVQQLQSLLTRSNELLRPLADPLTADYGAHRWLAAGREEAYSDWLEWVIRQVRTPKSIFRILGIESREALADCSDAPLTVGRELPVPHGHPDREGRLDLWIRVEGKAVLVVEVKKWDADRADTAKQAGYWKWLSAQGEHYKYAILLAGEGSEEIYDGSFRFLSWSSLCAGLRRHAPQLCAEGKVIAAAMILAFVGAVEQNLLGFSAPKPADVESSRSTVVNPKLVAHLRRSLQQQET
jgi:hypothetical protein